ncbi:hypothetical protein MNBD_GAMMA09-1460 [hydrothermal vent metagenome]|uniref:Uncharacterized protein n=1 Tax=hydrothermal vent metagenome TaxID=652676 RepID=A0A3B0XH48_9ZZZZ
MKISVALISIVFLPNFFINSATIAASLDKYGSTPQYNAAPIAKKSKRDLLIDKAVRQYNGASKEDRRQLLEAYRNAFIKAEKAGNTTDASFYRKILSRINS